MALIMEVKPLADACSGIPGFSMTYDVVHMPALGLVGLWRGLGLPPSGDAAFALYPYSVVVQWLLFGSLIGFVRRFRK
jgi:hypothetical protein